MVEVLVNEPLSFNEWNHVVINVLDEELQIWVNNQLVTRKPREYDAYYNSGEPTHVGNEFSIGGDFNYHYYLNGSLDEARIYNRALSGPDIQRLYTEPLCEPGDDCAYIDGIDVSLYQCSNSSLLTVQRAYIAYYGRPGDYAGINYWCQRLDDEGGSLDSIMEAFGFSDEFLHEYGHLSDEELIWTVYDQLYNREPDPDGFQFYLNQLVSGRMSLQTITLSVLFGTAGTDAEVLAAKEYVALYHASAESMAINAGQTGNHDLIYWIADDVVDTRTQENAIETIDFYFNEYLNP